MKSIIDTDRQTEVMKMNLRLRLFCSHDLRFHQTLITKEKGYLQYTVVC